MSQIVLQRRSVALALVAVASAVLAAFLEAVSGPGVFFERDIPAYWYAQRRPSAGRSPRERGRSGTPG